MKHDDKYSTCYETHACFRAYSKSKDPDNITRSLSILPTSVQRIGDHYGKLKLRTIKINGWFLESEKKIKSKDSRRHLDYLLRKLYPKRMEILSLQKKGWRMDVSCYWSSRHGQGGPTISPSQMKKLAELNIDLWYDYYS